jgi:hypothetical protein
MQWREPLGWRRECHRDHANDREACFSTIVFERPAELTLDFGAVAEILDVGVGSPDAGKRRPS